MSTRTRTAHLGALNDEGKTIRVTYWPADQVFQFKGIGGEPGKLPWTYTLADLWQLVRQAEERAKPQKLDPNQLEHPVLVGAEVSIEVRHEVLPEAGLEVRAVADVQPVQEPAVGAEQPAEERLQESPEPGEAAGEDVRSDVRTVRAFRGTDGIRLPEGQVIYVPLHRPHKPRARIYGVEHPGDPAGNERPPVPLQDAPVDEGRDGESRAGVA